MKNAPDIIVGYAAGYRSSWNTALGQFDKSIVVDNKKAWSADHCVDHDLVPGIVVTNKPINRADPALIDLGARRVLARVRNRTRLNDMTGQLYFRTGPEIGLGQSPDQLSTRGTGEQRCLAAT